ncbi:MAG TPA: hypothetical protein VK251_08655 [Steroidobacteraceae bacterium]|nr:hypothetical protein [Steroidobacteraceae bacterium]
MAAEQHDAEIKQKQEVDLFHAYAVLPLAATQRPADSFGRFCRA